MSRELDAVNDLMVLSARTPDPKMKNRLMEIAEILTGLYTMHGELVHVAQVRQDIINELKGRLNE